MAELRFNPPFRRGERRYHNWPCARQSLLAAGHHRHHIGSLPATMAPSLSHIADYGRSSQPRSHCYLFGRVKTASRSLISSSSSRRGYRQNSEDTVDEQGCQKGGQMDRTAPREASWDLEGHRRQAHLLGYMHTGCLRCSRGSSGRRVPVFRSRLDVTSLSTCIEHSQI